MRSIRFSSERSGQNKKRGRAHDGADQEQDRSDDLHDYLRAIVVRSLEDVFDAWTDPDQIKQWWDPTGTPLADCAVDLRPGGAFRFTMASTHAPPFAGTYQRVERPAELVFEAMGAIGTVRLERDAGATRMTVTIRCASEEHLAQFLKLGLDEGTGSRTQRLRRGACGLRHSPSAEG